MFGTPRNSVVILSLVLFTGFASASQSSTVDERLLSVIQGAANALEEDTEFRLLQNDSMKMKAFRETISMMLMSLSQDASTVERIANQAQFSLEQPPEAIGQAMMNQAKRAGITKLQVFLEACSRAKDTFALSSYPRDHRPLRAILAGTPGATPKAQAQPSGAATLEDLANSVLGSLN